MRVITRNGTQAIEIVKIIVTCEVDNSFSLTNIRKFLGKYHTEYQSSQLEVQTKVI